MQIEIRTSFSRDAKKYPQQVKNNIAKAIKEIYAAESLSELKNIKNLKGGKAAKEAYRMRIDDYRICFLLERWNHWIGKSIAQEICLPLFPLNM